MKPRIGAVPARYRRNRIRLAALAAFTAVPVATLMALQKPQQPTSPFEVYSAFSGTPSQDNAQVAVDADGDAVVVFSGDNYDGDGDSLGVKALKIDAHGRFIASGGALDPTGEPQVVNTTISGTQALPAIAMDRDGDFVVAWQSGPYDYGQYDIFFQRFDRDFRPVGPEVQVTTGASSLQSRTHPSVAMDADGDFVLVWADNAAVRGIRGRRFLADGTPDGAEFNVPSQGGFSRGQPRVAMNAQGDFAVAWVSFAQDGSGDGVYARAFTAAGVPRGPSFLVNTVTSFEQSAPDIAMDADGDFVIAWNDIDVQYFATVQFQRYDAVGAAVGANTGVIANPSGNDRRPSVSMADDGDFTIAWTASYADPDESTGILARRFAADGTPLGNTFHVNATPEGAQTDVDIALDADSDIAITYTSYYGEGARARPAAAGDVAAIPSGPVVLFRRFTGGEPVDLAIRERAPSTAPVPADIEYTAEYILRNDHATPTADGIGTATGVAVDFISDFGSFIGIDQPGWECSTADFCITAGFCLTCASDHPIPAGGRETVTVRLQAPPDPGLATTSVAANLNQHDPQGADNARTLERTVVPQDDTPDAIDFPTQRNVPRGSQRTSEPVVITGINVPTSLIVSDGRYSKNGGPFTAQEGTAVEGDTIVLRHRAADDFSTATVTRVTVGGVTGRFRSVTEAIDTTPDAFSFPKVTNAPLSTQQVSQPATVSGINQPARISVEGGEFAVNDNAFTATEGSAVEGDTVRVRRQSAAEPGTTVKVHLTIGGVTGVFSVTTVPPDQSPDPFAFASQDGVPVASVRVSNAITVSGINTTTPISVDQGRYRVNGGSFTAADGTVEAGDTVIVQQTSANTPSTEKVTTLTIGDRAGSFTTTTTAPDDDPNAFAFTAQTGVPLDSLRVSNAIVVGGINVAVDISVAGGQYSVNNLAYRSAAGSVKAGDVVRVRHTSASIPATTVTTTLSIGDASAPFRSTTVAQDATPDAFAFVDASGAAPGAKVDSNTIVVSGINVPVPIGVTGGKYRINGGAYRTFAGTVSNGDQVQVRAQASGTQGAKVDAVLTIGGVSDTFSVTTAP